MKGGSKVEEKTENILVSACLLGVNCRYDGGNGKREEVLSLMEHYNLIPVCPEQLGGLMTPREPAERQKDGLVRNQQGQDVTSFFKNGAEETLRIGKLYGCKRAILKERSPSCGHGVIYDGTFSGSKIDGSGMTAELLEKHGIEVTGESRIDVME
jgi:uncharacterized protein YbbK (DUF523 family)